MGEGRSGRGAIIEEIHDRGIAGAEAFGCALIFGNTDWLGPFKALTVRFKGQAKGRLDPD